MSVASKSGAGPPGKVTVQGGGGGHPVRAGGFARKLECSEGAGLTSVPRFLLLEVLSDEREGRDRT